MAGEWKIKQSKKFPALNQRTKKRAIQNCFRVNPNKNRTKSSFCFYLNWDYLLSEWSRQRNYQRVEKCQLKNYQQPQWEGKKNQRAYTHLGGNGRLETVQTLMYGLLAWPERNHWVQDSRA